MKIAYGTYAMPTVPLEEAFGALARIGYDGVEICISSRHVGASPEEMNAARRRGLRDLLKTHNLGVPALFVTGHLYAANDDEQAATMEQLRVCAQLARDLGMSEPPVLAMGIGGGRDAWDAVREVLPEQLGAYGELARQEDFIIAGEAHCGAAVDRSERVVWLMDAVADPRVRFHFDIVHLFLAGEPIADAVKTLVPYTAHTHITDAVRHADGTFKLVLLGQGELDATTYMRAMADAGWDDFITLEVSTMVWSQEGYDPLKAAQYCYESLVNAFEQAGVARG